MTAKNPLFMHYRNHNTDGSIASNGGMTVAIMVDPDDRQTALVGISRCKDNEVFNKKIGRDVALGRMRAWSEGRSNDRINTNVFQLKLSDPENPKMSVDSFIEEVR